MRGNWMNSATWSCLSVGLFRTNSWCAWNLSSHAPAKTPGITFAPTLSRGWSTFLGVKPERLPICCLTPVPWGVYGTG